MQKKSEGPSIDRRRKILPGALAWWSSRADISYRGRTVLRLVPSPNYCVAAALYAAARLQ